MRIEKIDFFIVQMIAIFIAICCISLSAFGQENTSDQATGTPTEEELIEQALQRSFEEEITVTGSLIPRGDLTALSPVTVMEVEQELTYSGVNRLEDLVVSLPQVFSSQNATIANGASGTATIDLRFLGAERTLVLVNGRRLAAGDAWQGTGSYTPDIHQIPAALVKRVDVLTGGASTVYGTDAVAGVVNFIMDTEFEGFRGGFQYSFYQHDNNNDTAQRINQEAGFDVPSGSTTDGDAINAYFAVGGKFADGKGHAVAYATYRKIDEILKGYRDYTNCAVSAGDDGPECGGSPTIPQGRFYAFNADGTANDPGDGWMVQGDQFVDASGVVFNYGPFNHLQRPDEKFTAGAFAHYTVSEYFEPYLELMAMSNYTDAQIAPTGTFYNSNFVNCDNPFLSDQQFNILCGPGTGYGPNDLAEVYLGKRNVEGDARSNALGHDTLRIVAGIRGDLNDQWSYDFYGLHAQNHSTDVYNNDMSIARLNLALDAVEDDQGNIVCRSGGNCVPYNVFEEGAITREMTDYLRADIVMTGRVTTQVVNLTFTGDLEEYGIRIPSASEGLALATGFEWRGENIASFPDEIYQFGGATGQGGGVPKVDAGYEVQEWFLELAVPIVQDRSVFQDLTLELGYRFSDYSTSGGLDAYKALLNWAINDSFRIRGGYNRAVRAPNVWQLFQPARFGLGGAADICAGTNPTATLEQCLRTGMTEAQYGTAITENPADQYNNLGGGNPDLEPETAETLTAGLVITPQSVPGLSLTFDYYNIQIEDTVGILGFDDVLQNCANTGNPVSCSLINRDNQGTLWLTQAGYISTQWNNVGELAAEGVDFNANYLINLGGAGFLPIDLNGTYTLANAQKNPLIDYDCVGYFGFQCFQPLPEWRHRFRATWESNFNLFVSLAWRYIGEVQVDDASDNPDLGDPGSMDLWRANDIDTIPAYNWFDLSVSYLMKSGIRWTVGVNNIFDEEPPLAPTFNDDGNINLYSVYDPFGRYVFAGVQFSL